jgi:hypothetical protein
MKRSKSQASILEPVFIIWEDAVSVDEWTPFTDINIDNETLIHTAGFLIEENDKRLAVAVNIDTENESASCIMIIPKNMIRARISLDK